METKKFYIILALSIFVVGCAKDEPFDSGALSTKTDIDAGTLISHDKAITTAQKFWESTRSETYYDFDYLTNPTSGDTLGYIINRGRSEGWAIVSAYSEDPKVVAYADEGSFTNSYDASSIVQCHILSGLRDLLAIEKANSRLNDHPSITKDASSIYYSKVVSPKLSRGYWHQYSPWNKYIQDSLVNLNPGVWANQSVPVGCVPLCTSLIMAHCKPNINYHGRNFNFEYMLQCIRDSIPEPSISPGINPVLPPIIRPTNVDNLGGINLPLPNQYRYGVDIMARLLLYVGRDLNAEYNAIDGTSANSLHARDLLMNLGYQVELAGYFLITYNPVNMVERLIDDRLIYISGSWSGYTDEYGHYYTCNETKGHSWLIDGCRYSVYGSTSNIKDIYFHNQWLEATAAPGYYSADLMKIIVDNKTLDIDPNSLKYFSVKIEH